MVHLAYRSYVARRMFCVHRTDTVEPGLNEGEAWPKKTG